MDIRNNTTEITLGTTTYRMKFDFEVIAQVQADLKKQGLPYKFFEIFEGLEAQDFSVIVPVFVHSIMRCHRQAKPEAIKNHLTFDNLELILTKLMELIGNSMPKQDESKKNK